MSFCSIINGCVSDGRIPCYQCGFNYCDKHIGQHHCGKVRKIENAAVPLAQAVSLAPVAPNEATTRSINNNATSNCDSSNSTNNNNIDIVQPLDADTSNKPDLKVIKVNQLIQCFESEVAPSDCWKFLLTQNQNLTKQQIYNIVAITLCTHCFNIDASEMIPIMQSSMQHIRDCLFKLISKKSLSQIAKEAAKRSNFIEMKTLKRDEEKRFIFEGAFIILLLFEPELLFKYNVKLYQSIPQMLTVYPDFEALDSTEIERLLDFCNFMKLGIVLQPAKGHKGHLMDLITKLTEGKSAKYICGGGQSLTTTRRVQIYEYEGGVQPLPRPWRIPWSKISQWVDSERAEHAATTASSSSSSSSSSFTSSRCDSEVDLPSLDALINSEKSVSPQQIINALQQHDPEHLVNKTITSLMLAPEMHLEAHELASADGLTFVRALSLKRIIENHDGSILRTDELARCFSISQPKSSSGSNGSSSSTQAEDDDIWKENEVSSGQVQKEGVSISRQVNNIQGQMVQSFSLSKQLLPPPAPDEIDSDDEIDYSLDDELFDWLKATSTSARSVSHLRQSSHVSFSRVPSVATSAAAAAASGGGGGGGMSFSRLSSSGAGAGRLGTGTAAAASLSLQEEPSNQDWHSLIKRNRMAQAERESQGHSQSQQSSDTSGNK